MEKFTEMLGLMWRAFVYSLAFCWRNDWWGTLLLIIFAGISSGVGFALALIGSELANTIQSHGIDFGVGPVPWAITKLVILLVIVLAINESASLLSWFITSRWQQTMRFANRRELDEHFATLDVARIKSKEFDDLRRSIDEQPLGWGVRIELMDGMLGLFGAVVSFASFGIALLWMQPYYAIILVVSTVPLMIHQFLDTARWWKMSQDLVPTHKSRSILERAYKSNTSFVQAKSYDQFPMLRRDIDSNIEGVKSVFARMRLKSLSWGIVTQLVAVLGASVVIYLAVVSIWQPDGSIGTLVLIIPAVRTMSNSLKQVVEVLAEQFQSLQAVVLIEEGYLQLGPLLVKGGNDRLLSRDDRPALSLEHVTFAYPNAPEKPVLEDVTVKIPFGTKVAIVGENGSGKSTLMSLLLRHYDPSGGVIKIGTTALTDLSVRGLSRYMTALFQDYEVQSRPLGHEIASARLGIPHDENRVRIAVANADLTRVIAEDPFGLDVQIGVEFGGRDFSGGQRQRIALARTLYGLGEETKLLLLDEAEAKLDPESAERVIQNILGLSEVTVLMVTHFIARALDFGLVMVMEGGKLVEFGPPHEIAKQDGVFARLLHADENRRGG